MAEKRRTLAQLAEMVDGELLGDPTVTVGGVAELDAAAPDDIVFITKPAMVELLTASRAAAVIVPLGVDAPGKPAIRVRDPYLAVAVIHQWFVAEPFVAAGVHPAAHVGEGCLVPSQVCIEPLAVLGNRVQLGERVVIHSGVVVGDDVMIGDDTVLHANVSVRSGCRIGRRVIIHDGAVVGSDGFGYATDSQGNHFKRPQVGIVQIDDDVEIGANACIDRATFGTTWVKRGAKIDNLVQIGHNVVVGESTILVGQVGIAGSTKLGRNVVMGGQAGTAGHIELGDGVMVAGKSGVHNSQAAGAVVAGIPAIPHRQWLRVSAALAKLPELAKAVRALEKKFEKLAGSI